jgi:rhamnosyltransferase
MQKVISDKLKTLDVCAIIVAYFPDSGFAERLSAILTQVNRIIIVNNGSDDSLSQALEVFSVNKKIVLIQNHQNFGIAKALNQGINRAASEGYAWVWSFDQDTTVSQGILNKLTNYYDQHIDQKIGIVAPNYYDLNSRRYCIDLDRQSNYFEMPSVINSGSLIKLSVFFEVGEFNEKFFIDCVDDDYCLRMREKNYKTILVKDAVINHKIGLATCHKLFNKHVITTNHSALRRYYWSRNGFSLVFRYIVKEPLLATGILKSHITTIIIALLFEKQRIKKLRYLLLGVFDAVFNKFDRSLVVDRLE